MPIVALSEEQIRTLTDAAIDELKPKIVKTAIEQVGYQITAQVQDLVREQIAIVLNEEFKRSLTESLAESKPLIAEQAAIAAVKLSEVLVTGLVTQAAKTMSDDYKRRQVLVELIGKY